MPRVPFLFEATENIPYTPGFSLWPFFVPKRIGYKVRMCVTLQLRRFVMRRTKPYPNLHPLVARHLGIRLMYAPPYRHVPHAPIRPLVVCGNPPFAGASLYFLERRRRNLRRHFIMDIAQMLSGLAPITLLSLSVSQLIDDPRWYLISIIPQTCLYVRLTNWWMKRFPHA